MARFPLLKGERLRATLVDSCGLPIEGPGNRIIIDSFVTASLEPVLKDRAEIEQNNANGEVCISETTAPQRKRYNFTLTLCDVNTCLFSKFTGWKQYLDFEGNAIGFDDCDKVQSDYGVAIEIWTGATGSDSCDIPEDDSIFESAVASAKQRGYVLFFAKEFTVGGFNIGETVSTPTLTGITFAAPKWGRGPYNVQEIDALGTAGRMLTPMTYTDDCKSHLRSFLTKIAPPAAESDCCFLGVQSIFTDPDFYYGGPLGEPAADVAPDQPVCDPPLTDEVQTLNRGGATGGTATFSFNGSEQSAAVTFGAALPTAIALQTALEGLSTIGTGNVAVTGAAGGPFTITFQGDLADTDVPLIAFVDSTTGGTGLTIVETVKGGQLI